MADDPTKKADPSIESALTNAVESVPAPPPPAHGGSIDAALASYSAKAGQGELSPSQTVVRAYRVREVAVILATFALAMIALDSEGLVTWARRMEVGEVQGAWLGALSQVQRSLETVGLTLPRRALVDAADFAARALGAGEDPLFAEAWGLVEVAPYIDAEPEPEPGIEVPAPLTLPGADVAPAVLLVGDSMFAGNLGAAAKTALTADGFKVVEAYQIATGLSRPDLFDWSRVVAGMMDRERPRFVVCSFGANDGQALRLKDAVLPFADPGWDAVYRLRVLALMRQAARGGARVLWLGLPPMRDGGLNYKVKHLNRLFARAAREVPGVEYLEVGMLFGGPDGGFATFVSNGKSLVRMRMEDGVHYSPAGAYAVARWVKDWIRERQRAPAPAGR